MQSNHSHIPQALLFFLIRFHHLYHLFGLMYEVVYPQCCQRFGWSVLAMGGSFYSPIRHLFKKLSTHMQMQQEYNQTFLKLFLTE